MGGRANAERVLSKSRLFSEIALGIAAALEIHRQRLSMSQAAERAAAGLEGRRLTRAAIELIMNMQELPDSLDNSLEVIDDSCDIALIYLEKGIRRNILKSVVDDYERSPALLDQDLEVTLADKEKLPKLYALAKLRRTLKFPMTDFREEDTAIGEKLARYVDFDYFLGRTNNRKTEWDRFESRIALAFSRTIDQAESEVDGLLTHRLTEKEVVKLGQAEEFSKAIQGLFNRLESSLKTCCVSAHEARIRLSDFTQVQLDLNVPQVELPNTWCPAIFTDHRYWDADEYAGSVKSLDATDTLCSTVTASARLQKPLQLTFESQGLWRPDKEKGAALLRKSFRQSSSLRDIMAFPRLNISKASKRQLLVNLARALLLLLGTSWWTKHDSDIADMLFIEHDTKNKMECDCDRVPYIKRPFGPYAAITYNGAVFGAEHPVFLEYALLLLQFETGKKLEPTDDDLDLFTGEFMSYLMLQRLLDGVHEEVGIKCHEIAKACLESDSHLLGSAAQHHEFKDSLRVKAFIYKQIYKPLLEVLEYDFPTKAAGLDLPDWPVISSQPAQSTQAVNGPKLTQPLEHAKGAQTSGAEQEGAFMPPTLPCVASVSEHQSHIRHNLLIFDVNTAYHAERANYASQFFEHHERFLLTRIRRNASQPRVKIALLDTGLDQDNSEVRGLKWKERCNGHDSTVAEAVSFDGGHITAGHAEDTDGHGTHTACLLMKIAPHADLYIAKIASTADNAFDGLKNVVEAIKWAVKKRVDIISMSFGFPGSTDLSELATQIEEAHKANIILFAAASNNGGNGRRTYPAKDPYVMCIHAVDGFGNNCGGFNPSAIHNEDNFATLGIGIECVWDEKWCSRSGTSYATPIAAGFAANALEFATYHKERGILKPLACKHLRKPFGMRQMFRLMAYERDGYQYVQPWEFWRENRTDDWICGTMEQELG